MPAELREILEEQLNSSTESSESGSQSAAVAAPTPESEPTPIAEPEVAPAPIAEPEAAPAPVEETKDAPPTEPTKQTEEAASRVRVDRAPQSWKNEAKAVWSTLPLAARQEVTRREQQVNQVLQEASQYKNALNELNQVIQPFQGRLQQFGASPVQALGALLQADNVLSTAPAPQRAQYMAKLIKDYGVDVQLLDDALSGQYTPEARQQDSIQQLLEQQLQPYKQFMQQTLAQQQAAVAAQQQQVANEVAAMSQDPNFPHFEQVRGDMADILDLAQKQGRALTLADAYHRAVAYRPELMQIEQQRVASNDIRARAQQASQQVSRAASAAVSVAGAPASSTRQPDPADLRALLEASFEDTSGRV